jgi:hypothetical protein
MPVTTDLRCSSRARDQQVDPIGAARRCGGLLPLEPLPWPRDVSEIAEKAPVAIAARSAGCRVQAVVPTPGGSRSRSLLAGEEAGDGTVTLSVGMGEGQRTCGGRVAVERTLPPPNGGVVVSHNDKTADELAVTELYELPRSQEVQRP